MKKLLLIVTFLMFNSTIFSQQKINVNDLIGYWQPDQESTQLFFWKDTNGKLQVQELSGTSGLPLTIIELKVRRNSVFIKQIFLRNNCITESVYTFIDKKTLRCVVSGDSAGVLIYTKTK
jgi:hypothetical protein